MNDYLLEAKSIKKSFSGVPALKDGNFRLRVGTVHALCGGNGAGKSTFLSIVMGILRRDEGEILRSGTAVHFASPSDALENGISIIEQELSPVPAMSVAENMFLGREPVTKLGRVDFKTMNRNAQAVLDDLGFAIKATDIMLDLTVAKTQLVEIAKAISYDAEIIIMDEPTSALGQAEADQLFIAINKLRAKNKAVVYVSHRLSEIFEICDDYTVFRDGEFISDGRIDDITREQLIQMIVGRTVGEASRQGRPLGIPVLELMAVDANNGVSDISFNVRKSEILALYGLLGSGRTEVFERIFGLSSHEGGRILVKGEAKQITSPSEGIEAGIALVTEDRKLSGLILSESVRANVCLSILDRLRIGPNMSRKKEAAAAKDMIDRFKIKTANDQLLVSGLSGGNQQKVVLGKWFLTNPEILLLDEPTRGVDIGAKQEIYAVMTEFARSGGAIIMASSELDEVIGVADRVLVMRNGQISGELTGEEITAENMVHLAS